MIANLFVAKPNPEPLFRRLSKQLLDSCLVLALIGGLLLTTGCRGCLSSDPAAETAEEDAEDKTEKEKKKPDFVNRTPVLVPGYYPPKYDARAEEELKKLAPDVRSAMEEQNNAAIRYNRHKLGHWVEAHLSVIANNFNAEGRLQASSLSSMGEPVPIPSTDYFTVTQRPIALTKGEWKNLEIPVFLPRREKGISSALVNYVFDNSSGGIPFVSLAQGTPLMKPFQYHLVLLSERPDSYNFLKSNDCIRLRGKHFVETQLTQFYYIIPSLFNEPIPLPRQSLNWTSIAYVVWDDVDPEKLSRDQQEALLDWLHFGGQLILSGPDCLSKLQNSFLASYLPAQFESSRNLTNVDFGELNRNWAIPVPAGRPDIGQRTLKISDETPLLGVRFNPHQDAQYVAGTGELAIERQLGRGRIVITSFSLNAPGVRKWQSFSSFVNGALLRRPARLFQGRMNEVQVAWNDNPTGMFDPLIGSTLRFLSRDLSASGTPDQPAYDFEADQLERRASQFAYTESFPLTVGRRKLKDDRFFGGYQDTPYSGVGGWNDDSAISQAARATLLEAAGIVPPSSAFVLKMLGIYLAVLVPLNWLIFRLIGRVEWAWIAAPFIAIAGAVMVVRMASLDIGFVRSNTQVGIVEIHANYPRAHVAEYSALYTSLSTRYNVDLDNQTAQCLPFASVREAQFKKPGERYKGVTLKRTAGNRLEGLPIQSNSTGLLHTEFMLDLEGTIYVTCDKENFPLTINNGTTISIKNAGILWRDEQNRYRLAWIGDLPNGVTADLSFEDTSEKDAFLRWQNLNAFGNQQRRANAIWKKHFQAEPLVALDDLLAVDDLSAVRDQLETVLRRMLADEADESINLAQFEAAMSSIKSRENVQIGRIFDALTNLTLSAGEVRLIGSTDQPLGQTKFEPEATRNDRQTLVVVHLRRPDLKPAERDKNSAQDFVPVSDLDWKKEIEAEEDELRRQNIESGENEGEEGEG
jgi:hypothetical protein